MSKNKRMAASVFNLAHVSPLPKKQKGFPANSVGFKVEPRIVDNTLEIFWSAGLNGDSRAIRVTTPDELWDAIWTVWRDRPPKPETTAEAIARGVKVQKSRKPRGETKAEKLDRELKELGLA